MLSPEQEGPLEADLACSAGWHAACASSQSVWLLCAANESSSLAQMSENSDRGSHSGALHSNPPLTTPINK